MKFYIVIFYFEDGRKPVTARVSEEQLHFLRFMENRSMFNEYNVNYEATPEDCFEYGYDILQTNDK